MTLAPRAQVLVDLVLVSRALGPLIGFTVENAVRIFVRLCPAVLDGEPGALADATDAQLLAELERRGVDCA